MKEPGPDHPITITPAPRQVRVRFQNHVIASSDRALVLKEADYPPVFYIPREDVETGFMSKTAHTTHCPYKGDASYYSMLINGDLAENKIWSYEAPYPAMEQIRDLVAFYPDTFEIYEVDAADIADRHRPEFSAAWPSPNSGAR
jgi:uncharacterized protein (DUF427 family)